MSGDIDRQIELARQALVARTPSLNAASQAQLWAKIQVVVDPEGCLERGRSMMRAESFPLEDSDRARLWTGIQQVIADPPRRPWGLWLGAPAAAAFILAVLVLGARDVSPHAETYAAKRPLEVRSQSSMPSASHGLGLWPDVEGGDDLKVSETSPKTEVPEIRARVSPSTSPRSKMERVARTAVRAGRFDRSDRATQPFQPEQRDPSAQLREAQALLRGNATGAEVAAKTILQGSPPPDVRIGAWMVLADVHRRKGQAAHGQDQRALWGQAAEIYGRVVAHPDAGAYLEEAMLRQAQLYRRLGQYTEALEVLVRGKESVGLGLLGPERAALERGLLLELRVTEEKK